MRMVRTGNLSGCPNCGLLVLEEGVKDAAGRIWHQDCARAELARRSHPPTQRIPESTSIKQGLPCLSCGKILYEGEYHLCIRY